MCLWAFHDGQCHDAHSEELCWWVTWFLWWTSDWGLWCLLWSPDLNLFRFYLWCMPAHEVSVNNCVSLQDLKESIWQEILAVPRKHISHVFRYFVKVWGLHRSRRLAFWGCCKVSCKSGDKWAMKSSQFLCCYARSLLCFLKATSVLY